MIAIGSDHGGYALKGEIIRYLEEKGITVRDFGCYSPDAVDYPDVAVAVCGEITEERCEKGILICGTGIGISIAANKVNGIRAALCHSSFDGGCAECTTTQTCSALAGVQQELLLR